MAGTQGLGVVAHSDLIATARELAGAVDGPLPRQTNLRRAVSTTYYSLFHCLAENCADTLVGEAAGTERSEPCLEAGLPGIAAWDRQGALQRPPNDSAVSHRNPKICRSIRKQGTGAEMGRLVPAHHPGDAGPCLSGGGPATSQHLLQRQKGGESEWDEALIPLTVPEVRRLLYRLIWQPRSTAKSVLKWSRWRRRHQARARLCHYKRRAAVVLGKPTFGGRSAPPISSTVWLRTAPIRWSVKQQGKRERADYEPSETLEQSDAILDIEAAAQCIAQFRQAPERDRRAFAVYVLLNLRNS